MFSSHIVPSFPFRGVFFFADLRIQSVAFVRPVIRVARRQPPAAMDPSSGGVRRVRAYEETASAMILSWLRIEHPELLPHAARTRTRGLQRVAEKDILAKAAADGSMLAELISILAPNELSPASILRSRQRVGRSAPVPLSNTHQQIQNHSDSMSPSRVNSDVIRLYNVNTRRVGTVLGKVLPVLRADWGATVGPSHLRPPERWRVEVDRIISNATKTHPSHILHPWLSLVEIVLAYAMLGPDGPDYVSRIRHVTCDEVRHAVARSLSASAAQLAIPTDITSLLHTISQGAMQKEPPGSHTRNSIPPRYPPQLNYTHPSGLISSGMTQQSLRPMHTAAAAKKFQSSPEDDTLRRQWTLGSSDSNRTNTTTSTSGGTATTTTASESRTSSSDNRHPASNPNLDEVASKSRLDASTSNSGSAAFSYSHSQAVQMGDVATSGSDQRCPDPVASVNTNLLEPQRIAGEAVSDKAETGPVVESNLKPSEVLAREACVLQNGNYIASTAESKSRSADKRFLRNQESDQRASQQVCGAPSIAASLVATGLQRSRLDDVSAIPLGPDDKFANSSLRHLGREDDESMGDRKFSYVTNESGRTPGSSPMPTAAPDAGSRATEAKLEEMEYVRPMNVSERIGTDLVDAHDPEQDNYIDLEYHEERQEHFPPATNRDDPWYGRPNSDEKTTFRGHAVETNLLATTRRGRRMSSDDLEDIPDAVHVTSPLQPEFALNTKDDSRQVERSFSEKQVLPDLTDTGIPNIVGSHRSSRDAVSTSLDKACAVKSSLSAQEVACKEVEARSDEVARFRRYFDDLNRERFVRSDDEAPSFSPSPQFHEHPSASLASPSLEASGHSVRLASVAVTDQSSTAGDKPPGEYALDQATHETTDGYGVADVGMNEARTGGSWQIQVDSDVKDLLSQPSKSLPFSQGQSTSRASGDIANMAASNSVCVDDEVTRLASDRMKWQTHDCALERDQEVKSAKAKELHSFEEENTVTSSAADKENDSIVQSADEDNGIFPADAYAASGARLESAEAIAPPSDEEVRVVKTQSNFVGRRNLGESQIVSETHTTKIDDLTRGMDAISSSAKTLLPSDQMIHEESFEQAADMDRENFDLGHRSDKRNSEQLVGEYVPSQNYHEIYDPTTTISPSDGHQREAIRGDNTSSALAYSDTLAHGDSSRVNIISDAERRDDTSTRISEDFNTISEFNAAVGASHVNTFDSGRAAFRVAEEATRTAQFPSVHDGEKFSVDISSQEIEIPSETHVAPRSFAEPMTEYTEASRPVKVSGSVSKERSSPDAEEMVSSATELSEQEVTHRNEVLPVRDQFAFRSSDLYTGVVRQNFEESEPTAGDSPGQIRRTISDSSGSVGERLDREIAAAAAKAGSQRDSQIHRVPLGQTMDDEDQRNRSSPRNSRPVHFTSPSASFRRNLFQQSSQLFTPPTPPAIDDLLTHNDDGSFQPLPRPVSTMSPSDSLFRKLIDVWQSSEDAVVARDKAIASGADAMGAETPVWLSPSHLAPDGKDESPFRSGISREVPKSQNCRSPNTDRKSSPSLHDVAGDCDSGVAEERSADFRDRDRNRLAIRMDKSPRTLPKWGLNELGGGAAKANAYSPIQNTKLQSPKVDIDCPSSPQTSSTGYIEDDAAVESHDWDEVLSKDGDKSQDRENRSLGLSSGQNKDSRRRKKRRSRKRHETRPDLVYVDGASIVTDQLQLPKNQFDHIRINRDRLDWLTQELLAARDALHQKDLELTLVDKANAEQREVLLLEKRDAEAVVAAMRKLLQEREQELQEARRRLATTIAAASREAEAQARAHALAEANAQAEAARLAESKLRQMREAHEDIRIDSEVSAEAPVHEDRETGYRHNEENAGSTPSSSSEESRAHMQAFDHAEMRRLWDEVRSNIEEKVVLMIEKRDRELAELREELNERHRAVNDLNREYLQLVEEKAMIASTAAATVSEKESEIARRDMQLAETQGQLICVTRFSKKLEDTFAETEHLRAEVAESRAKMAAIASSSGVTSRETKELREALEHAQSEASKWREVAAKARAEQTEASHRADEAERLYQNARTAALRSNVPKDDTSENSGSDGSFGPSSQQRPSGGQDSARHNRGHRGGGRSGGLAIAPAMGSGAAPIVSAIRDRVGAFMARRPPRFVENGASGRSRRLGYGEGRGRVHGGGGGGERIGRGGPRGRHRNGTGRNRDDRHGRVPVETTWEAGCDDETQFARPARHSPDHAGSESEEGEGFVGNNFQEYESQSESNHDANISGNHSAFDVGRDEVSRKEKIRLGAINQQQVGYGYAAYNGQIPRAGDFMG